MSTVHIHPRVIDSVVYEETGIDHADCTDGGAAIGTLTCGFTLPVGFWIEKCWLTNVTGFTGSTTATIQIGDGSPVDKPSIASRCSAARRSESMKTENTVTALAALAQDTRLAVYRLLVHQGPSGMAAGETPGSSASRRPRSAST